MRLAFFMLVLGAVSVGCGDDGGPADTGDTGVDAADTSIDATALLCQSENLGCQAACQYTHDCVVQSGIATQVYAGLGFTPPDWDSCSPCLANCESGDPAANASALTCFETMYEASLCDGSADPTVASGAINACCAGQTESSFCLGSCYALLNADTEIIRQLVPVCEELAVNTATPPRCAGTCPAVTDALLIPVTGDAQWRPRSFAIDTDGSVAVVGFFTGGMIDFGAGAHVAPATSSTQIVASFAADGTPRFSHSLSAGHVDFPDIFAERVAFDDAGNVIVYATLRSSLDLGAGALTPVDGDDLLLASWTSDGTLRWAQSFGGMGADIAQGLTVDGGEILIVASFETAIDLGGGSLTSAGDFDFLVARFDADGGHLWSRSYGAEEPEFAYDAIAHPSGEYTLIGGASSGVDFGDGPLTSAGDQDCFVARFMADGTLRWRNLFGGSVWDVAYQAAADGEEVVVGAFFAEGSIGDVAGMSISGTNQMLLRTEADGTMPWVSPNEIIPYEVGHVVQNLSVGADGRIDMTASSGTPSADVGGGPLTGARNTDIVLASYAPDGSHVWSMRLGGPRNESDAVSRRVATGELVVVGEFLDQLDYGGDVLTGEGRELFVLRFAAE